MLAKKLTLIQTENCAFCVELHSSISCTTFSKNDDIWI